MTSITSFRDLHAWQRSMELVDCVMVTTRSLPRTEFDLKRQMQRACISIPSNIAEGWSRKGRRGAYQNHVSIALGSHAELETQFEICFRNGLLNPAQCESAVELMIRTRQLILRLHDSLD